jgi:CcmD family protein
MFVFRKGARLGYVIAAYGIVIVSIAGYGLWLLRERRRLARQRDRVRSADSA